jgi:hypothetical protein
MKMPNWKTWMIIAAFVVSLFVTLTCYLMAWHGEYFGIAGVFIASIWGGLSRWFAKVLMEA